MKKSANRIFAALVLVGVALVFLNAGVAAHGQIVSISIPSLRMKAKERVTDFDLHIKSGRIARLPNLPIGWNVSVNNDPSWNTDIEASLIVGAAAPDASFFRDFLVVEKNESLGLPFDVEGEVIVTEDFVAQRQIRVGIQNLGIRELTPKRSSRSK